MTQLAGHTLAFIGEGNGLNDRCAVSAPVVAEDLPAADGSATLPP